MDINTLARLWGIDAHSVREHKQLEGADYLVIDLKGEPELARRINTGSADGKKLPDGDIFQADYRLHDKTRTFIADHAEKYRELGWSVPGDETQRVPGWRLGLESYLPHSAYAAVYERITFFTFDFQEGVYDLSSPLPDPFARPRMRYVLAYQGDGLLHTVSTSVVSGEIEVHHVPVGEDRMRLSATFSSVLFHMPNCREYFPEAPDHPFDVELTLGFYELMGDV